MLFLYPAKLALGKVPGYHPGWGIRTDGDYNGKWVTRIKPWFKIIITTTFKPFHWSKLLLPWFGILY